MTRKDYIAIATLIRNAKTSKAIDKLKDITIRLANYFGYDNKRFSHIKFFYACEYKDLAKEIEEAEKLVKE